MTDLTTCRKHRGDRTIFCSRKLNRTFRIFRLDAVAVQDVLNMDFRENPGMFISLDAFDDALDLFFFKMDTTSIDVQPASAISSNSFGVAPPPLPPASAFVSTITQCPESAFAA
jgi:hypothetical protein